MKEIHYLVDRIAIVLYDASEYLQRGYVLCTMKRN